MTLDARPQAQDSRSSDFDGSHRVRCNDRRASSSADDDITVLRVAADHSSTTPQAHDDDATVLRIARRARPSS